MITARRAGAGQVVGASDHVLVVGAGLAGLSAAMRLAGAGRRVTVVERAAVPGGRAGLVELPAPHGGSYRFDPGPTVLTMPDLIHDCFDAVGESTANWLTLHQLDPAYRATFADGSQLSVHADPVAMHEEIARVCGSAEAAGYDAFVDAVAAMYRYQMRDFIDRSIDSPLQLLGPNLARLVAAGGFGRLAPFVARYLKDPRTQRLYSFQAMYAGVSPYQALALYSVISYMDTVAGVFTADGGMHAVPEAMAAAAAAHGVEFRYNTEVVALDHRNGRAHAVITADGERIAADAFVLNPDLPVAYRDLLGHTPARVSRLRYSPSCFLMLLGSDRAYDNLAHHNIHFGHAWREVFDDLLQGRLMRDPSILVSNPTHSDEQLAPSGQQIYYVLAPTPNTRAGIDWKRTAPAYRKHLLDTLSQRGYPGLGEHIEVEHVITPADWEAMGLEAGAPFASAHTFTQTGPFRPNNRWGENVVFAGSGTQPGVGVPMVLVSGRLAAQRILGPDPTYRSRAWR